MSQSPISPPALLPRTLRREAILRAAMWRTERELARAARDGRPVLVGPWLSEIGFELLYWIPMLRQLARRHGLRREQLTAVSRGGAEPWYEDLCAGYVDVLDLVPPSELRKRNRLRADAARSEKQLAVTDFDRHLVAQAARRAGLAGAALLHPLVMYGRLRYLFAGQRPASTLAEAVDYASLPSPGPPPRELPRDYVAVKAYFSDCFPETEANRDFAAGVVAELRELGEVVLLSTGVELDEHRDLPMRASGAVHDASVHMTARDNLAVQSAIVGGARALVGTYGGFSYLGPFLGVPTASFFSERNFLPAHLDAVALATAEMGWPAPIVEHVSAFPTSREALRDLTGRSARR